jgi:hypothetical protein
MPESAVQTLATQPKFTPLPREPHNRHSVAYLVRDEHTKTLLLSQKLAPVVHWINERALTQAERVNLKGLYKAAGFDCSNRTGAMHKYRWRVYRLALGEVPSVLNDMATECKLVSL